MIRFGPFLSIITAIIIPIEAAGEVTVVNYMRPLSKLDSRQIFVQEIITASLEHTVKTDGPYKMVPAAEMNYDRAEAMLKRYPNMIARISGTNLRQKNWLIIPIPINRGIVGYRILLINRGNKNNYLNLSSLAELNEKGLKAGQGQKWADVEILKANDIEVVVVKL